MAKLDRPEIEMLLADAIRTALAEADEDALLQGSVDGRCTLIDGNFDLIAVAEGVLERIGREGRQELGA